MSIVRISPDSIERYTLQANPVVSFSSSSTGNTGSLLLFADGSSTLKDVFDGNGLYSVKTNVNDSNIETARGNASTKIYNSIKNNSGFNQYDPVFKYIDSVHSKSNSGKFSKNQEIARIVPVDDRIDSADKTVKFSQDSNFIKKRVVKDSLFPFYRGFFDSLQWNYTNYHSLNFVTGCIRPNSNENDSSAVLIYPALNAGTEYTPQ